jgi:ribonucleotide monophosphatase NagD (HAD superfamily)
MSAVTAIQASWRVLVCGGQGLIEEVRTSGAETVVAYEKRPISGNFDAVVVGFHREFDFQVLADALTAVRGGALLIGSNYDPTYPTPDGPIPGGGSIVAAIEKATGVTALITGKPCAPMAGLVRDMCPGIDVADMVMVGDRDDTDGAFARTLGCRFALVLSGVTPDSRGVDADIVAPALAGIVQHLLAP